MSSPFKTLAGTAAVIMIGSAMYATIETSNKEPRPQSNAKVTLPVDKVAPAPVVSNEQIQEMRTTYNQVLSNTLKPVYAGCAIRNENWINVYVNSLWYELNKGQKTEFITRCKNIYAGMLGARGIKIDFNAVNIFINFSGNEKILGKWSTFGVSINE